eukprot:8866632-Heterocapsa_arctica.AAC.1
MVAVLDVIALAMFSVIYYHPTAGYDQYSTSNLQRHLRDGAGPPSAASALETAALPPARRHAVPRPALRPHWAPKMRPRAAGLPE